jgi:hypothetical protein
MKIIDKSICYDDYWHFAYLRQERFLSSVSGVDAPTDDILQKYKFTNCYRAVDRVSQFLIRNVIYSEHFDAADTFFRIMIFKLFNKIETWQRLEKKIGVIEISSFDERLYASVLHDLKSDNEKIYSAAYIMPSGKMEYGSTIKHENNLRMLSVMLKKEFQYRVWEPLHLSSVYEMFLQVPSIGPFLAYQYATDIGYCDFSQVSEDQFVVAGPGALRGIRKCFPGATQSDSASIIRHMAAIQDSEFSRLGYDFQYLQNRKLQLIDCQNLFCEVDKYLRVKRPEFGNGNSRIKQMYRKNTNAIDFFFPPKWNASLPKGYI